MLKDLKPFLPPAVLLGTWAMNIGGFQSAPLGYVIFGMAACWLLLSVLTATRLREDHPLIAAWLPFLGSLRPRYALPGEISGSLVQGKVIRLVDFVDPRTSTIHDKTFEDCTLIGPAVVTPVGSDAAFYDCVWRTADKDAVMLPVPTTASGTILGVVGLDGCVFRRCDIHNISMMSPDWEKHLNKALEYEERLRVHRELSAALESEALRRRSDSQSQP